MAKRSLRRRLFEYAVVAVLLAGTSLVLLPVWAYSGPGPDANRVARLSQLHLSAWDYVREHDGKFPSDLNPKGYALAPLVEKHPPTRRSLVVQEPVPSTLWNHSAQGKAFEDFSHPRRTILYYEGAEDSRGSRLVTFVAGGTRAVPGPVVVNAILRHGGVVPDIFARDRATLAKRTP